MTVLIPNTLVRENFSLKNLNFTDEYRAMPQKVVKPYNKCVLFSYCFLVVCFSGVCLFGLFLLFFFFLFPLFTSQAVTDSPVAHGYGLKGRKESNEHKRI